MGDHLIALPLYRQLRRRHAGDALILVCNLPAAGNPKLISPEELLPKGLFDGYCSFPVGSGLRSSLRKLGLFRSLGLEVLYYLMPQRSRWQRRRDRIFFGLAGVDVPGLTHGSGPVWQETVPLLEDPPSLVAHELDRLTAQVPGLEGAVARTAASLSLGLSDREISQARELCGSTGGIRVVLSIGTKCEVNHWGTDQWSSLLRRLVELPSIDEVVFIGSADEFSASETLGAMWNRRWRNLCGRLTARLSAAVLADASLFIGHDSGPMHLAAAVGVPIVAIYSSRNLPGQWFPLSQNKRIHYTLIDCMGCGRLQCPEKDKACIRAITVQQVFESCAAAISGEAPPPSGWVMSSVLQRSDTKSMSADRA